MIADRIIFVCTVALAAVYWQATTHIPSLDIGDPLGPRAFPRLLAICLVIGAALLALEMRSRRRAEAAQDTPPAPPVATDHGHLWIIGGVVALTAVYFALFEKLGFLVSTAAYLFLLMAWFNRGKWLANTLTSVLFTAGIYALFVHVLKVQLAKGMLYF